jgi:excinuclease UvrABC nuclease subunit
MSGGCYAVFMDGSLAYVGSAVCLAQRLFQHRFWLDTSDNRYSTPWGKCATLEIRVREARYWAEWATLELRLIRRLAPRSNKARAGVKLPSASDLPIVWHGYGQCDRTLNRKTMRVNRQHV